MHMDYDKYVDTVWTKWHCTRISYQTRVLPTAFNRVKQATMAYTTSRQPVATDYRAANADSMIPKHCRQHMIEDFVLRKRKATSKIIRVPAREQGNFADT
ncbi:hypothetical protein C7443_10753 [Plasticicumulans acidivorans]|uniref:Uncharacterized protein n=1 Tax=Plasticicumulans acidivorans TaxID=886464 RepID=A0A317MUH1_9GAMM|nr:hypothetical protein C7443_10753 [Plasticicumulans acidivorans]